MRFWLLEMLYVAVNIIDRFLSAHFVSFAKLQLVGITCMFLAAIKVEEIVAPSAVNFLYCADFFCPVVSSMVNAPCVLHLSPVSTHAAHDRSLGLPTKVVALPAAIEVLLYNGYLRRMFMVGEVNLNLDCENLRAFPLSWKLYEYFPSCSSNTFYNNNGSFYLFCFMNVRVARGILL